MPSSETYFAVDLGATSGRTVIGTLTDGKIVLEELTRFDNHIIQTGRHCYWDFFALYHEVVKALKLAAHRGLSISSIGIDTWGVDIVCVGEDGELLRNPLAYRDPQNIAAMNHYLDVVKSREEVYRTTGIQFLPFNTLFQLHAMRRECNSVLKAAKKILFLPDALSYMLTGETVCEYTIAATSQLLNPHTKVLDKELLASVELSPNDFGTMVMPGTRIGTLSSEMQALTGLGAVPVVAVTGHDTSAAITAVPAANRNFAYLSSGTWSLMGIETEEPIISDISFERNFTNEGGIEGTIHFLKNITGMWLYECCRREWAEEGRDQSHATLLAAAAESEPFRSIIHPNDDVFTNPPHMITAIQDYCRATHQPVPETEGEICRCIFESLALCYRQVFAWLQSFASFALDTLHVIGGGSRNAFLNQLTANACGVKVVAGPQEGTALGNIMIQAKASGAVKDIHEMRQLIAHSIDTQCFEPQDSATWNRQFARYTAIIQEKK